MKTYVKPELYFESFELSQHIASCDFKLVNALYKDSCQVVKTGPSTAPDEFGTIMGGYFTGDTQSCDKKIGFDRFEHYCYTNGSGSLYCLFQS